MNPAELFPRLFRIPKAEHEILVGNTARSTEETASANLQQGQYLMLAKGGNIYFIGSSATLTTTLATEFKAYLDAKKGVLDDMNEQKSLIVPGEFAANTGDVRIMEYNVLVEFAGWGSGGKIPADVNLRKGIIASLINGYSPDVLCLCEFFDTWSQELPPLLDSKYKFVSLMRPDGLSNRTSLVYNSETLTLIEGGYEDISIHPTTDAPWNDDVNRRVIMWGVFEVKATGKRFMTLGTHYTSTAGATSELTAQEHLEAAQELAKKLEAAKVELKIKTGEGGRTFGSVSSKEIAIAVKEQLGYDLDKKKIQIKEAIRTPGMHLVPVKLHQKVTAELKVHVGEA